MDFDKPLVTNSPQETAHVGQKLGNWIKRKELRTICLYGELGSGKTTFVGGFAKAFGITARLLSPTFIIVRRYPLEKDFRFLYHVDLYRSEGKRDLGSIGLSEILVDPDSIVLVEWAEKLGDFLPKKHIDVRLKAHAGGKHSIWMTKIEQ